MQRLEIWQDGMKIVEGVYLASGDWPIDERFGLVSQVRRAAVSIPANIAEGIGRGTPRVIARFCRIFLGSAYKRLSEAVYGGHRRTEPKFMRTVYPV